MLKINKISFSYENHAIINDLSLAISSHEIVTLIGASGSGKTTLFKILTGILRPHSGSFSIAGQPQQDSVGSAAYMMQEDLLLPWRTVLGNLILVAELGKERGDLTHVKEQARYYLDEVGLSGWDNAYPDQLSGGMRQRVSLARALLQKRPLLLLDEPFAALDIGLREQMHALLHEVRAKHGTTILMVTHDFRDAMALSDRILLLSEGAIGREWTVKDHPFAQLHEQMREATRLICQPKRQEPAQSPTFPA